MVYINPIEILELSSYEVQQIDSTVIKKAKRKLFADIDLSDNEYYQYYGQSLAKSDCERAIEELQDLKKLEFYLHLASNVELNSFLAEGSGQALKTLRQESIYHLNSFVSFIGPFIAPKYDLILLKSFQIKDFALFLAAIRAQNLISSEHINRAFKSLSIELDNRISETDRLNRNIKEETSQYTDDTINSVVKLIQERFPLDYLNKLPKLFQSQINKVASSINYLQLSVWNEFNTTHVSVLLLEHLLSLNIESVSKPTFEKNYSIVKKKHEERLLQEKNAPLLKDWARRLVVLNKKVEMIENQTLKSTEALSVVKSIFDLETLNLLPEFANEIRTQIGYSIRSMSIASWNEQNDIKNSLELINYALKINVDSNARQKFIQDRSELEELRKKYEGILVCHFCEVRSPEKGCELNKTIYLETSRSWFPRRSVQYNYSEISIPRCKECQNIHSKGWDSYFLALVVFSFVGVLIGGLTEGEHYILGGIVGALLGWICGKILQSNEVKGSGIKDISESSLSKHPLLIERLKSGWSFNKPTA